MKSDDVNRMIEEMSEKHVHESDKHQLIKQAEEAFESAKERGWAGLTDDEIFKLKEKNT